MEQAITRTNTISEIDLTILCLEMLRDTPKIIDKTDSSYSKLNERILLLMALYNRIREQLGMGPKSIMIFPEDLALELKYRNELTNLFEFECQMRPRFNYPLVINEFIKEALRRIEDKESGKWEMRTDGSVAVETDKGYKIRQ